MGKEAGDICGRHITFVDKVPYTCNGIIGEVSKGDISWRRPGESSTYLGCTKCLWSYEDQRRPGSKIVDVGCTCVIVDGCPIHAPKEGQ